MEVTCGYLGKQGLCQKTDADRWPEVTISAVEEVDQQVDVFGVTKK